MGDVCNTTLIMCDIEVVENPHSGALKGLCSVKCKQNLVIFVYQYLSDGMMDKVVIKV